MSGPEHAVEKALRLGVKALGGLCLKLNPFRLKGIPDRLVLLPGGRLYFVELKAPDGDVKPWQARWHDRLVLLGFSVRVLWTVDQVVRFLATL